MNYYVTDATIDRLEADTGSGGLFNSGSPLVSGVYYIRAADASTRPYIVLNVSMTEEHALTSDGCEFVLGVRIVGNASDGGAALQSIWNRVFGDGVLQSGRTPSYGLHRHTLTMPTNPLSASCTTLMYAGTDEVYDADDNTLEWTMRFRSRWDAAAVSP